MVPLFMLVMVLPIEDTLSRIIAAAVFALTALTDMLDGKIARKYNLITDFGKFLDPLADKFMAFATMLTIVAKYDYIRPVFLWVVAIVMFRELAVTSMRLVVNNNSGIVVAANMLGKYKTVSQIVCVLTILLEPVIIPKAWAIHDMYILSYITMAVMTVLTIWSGINYLASYWKYIDPNK